MKRLPFALIALAFSIPAVACLNNASDEGSSSSSDLTELPKEVKDACSFKFAEVDKPVGQQLKLGPAGLNTSGQRMLWGDYNGDGFQDFMISAPPVNDHTGPNRVKVYLGAADGKFKSTALKELAAFPKKAGEPDRLNAGISLLATGDFDGDKKADAIVLRTTTAADGTDSRDDIHVLYGTDQGSSSSSAIKNAQNLLPLEPLTAESYYQATGDLDGDGKDDLVYTTAKGQTVAFGAENADKKVLVAVDVTIDSAAPRGLAFIQKKDGDKAATLYLVTSATANSPASLKMVTFDGQRKPTVADMPASLPTDSSRWIGTSLQPTSAGDIAVLGANGLQVLPVAPTQARGTNTYAGLPGYLIGAADFDGDKNKEILYAASATELYAACGTTANASEIVATALKVPFSDSISLAGYIDINNDGKADLVTLDTGADEATRGTVHVYLAAGKEDAPSEPKTFSAVTTPPADVDAGADTGTTTEVDSGTDTGTTTEVDSGADTGTTAEVDSGVDSGVDAGVDSGTTVKPPKPKPDGGTAKPTGDDDDDDGSSEGPPDGEGSGTKTDKPSKKPTTKPSTGATVTVIPKPQTTDDGCSVSSAPGSHGVTSGAFGGLFAAMMLLARRRRNKRA